MTEYIYLTGPDGVGKTHHVHQIRHNIKQDRGVVTVWLRFYHLFSMLLLAYGRIFDYSNSDSVNGTKIYVHRFDESYLLRKLYPPLLFFDTCLYWSYIWTKHHILSTEVIIFDRFIYDTIAQAMVSTGRDDILDLWYTKLFASFIPEQINIILLMADVDTLRSRRNDVNNDPKLERKIQVYKQISDHYNIQMISTQAEKDAVEKEISSIING